MVANSSSFMQQPLCHDSESSALLQFKQSFLINGQASGDPSAYPKVAMWKSHGEGEEKEKEVIAALGMVLSVTGRLAITLFSLVHLRRLDLSDNDFNYSEIPFGVGQLSRLRSLDLSYSVFSGQIPSELLALSNLVFLDLTANPMLELQKPGLRNLVQNLAHLEKLYLSEVNISSTIPHELANLSSLTTLSLRQCGLHGEFPMNIFQLPSLQFLSVGYNPDLIVYLPEFQETNPLKVLDISSCNFTGLVPSPLGHLPQLSYLDLSNNYFSGQIPSFMANLTQLTYLDLSFNNFSVGTLPWLENQLSGQIPSWLMNLTQLTLLDLGDNNLKGGIPSSLFELVNLQFLSVQGNSLNGTVELHMLSKLKNLTDFQLSGNRLSVLSYTRTNVTLPKFKLLGLGSCNLTEFPDFLQNQDELELLFLSNNRIHGPIPKWMWNISQENLGMLDLSGNLLTGFDQHPVVLPWSRLRALKLDYNMLQGPLPIPPPSTIEYSVSRNKLTGEISPLICNMSSLMLLDLSNNNLSGRIPQCLANLSKSLSVLDLGSNSLDGPIPQTCTVTNNLRVIDLGENQFQGQIPRSFANCMMLEHLVLGNNQIDDIFPFWLGALPQLQVLILRSNRFHGAIGSWQSNFRFPKLRIIDLSDNKFIGDLPSEYFQNWDAMKLTDIANNLRYMQTHPKFQIPGYSWIDSYMYSMRMTNKGMQRFYEQIPDIFIAIDFSGNNFKGQIPTSIGNLKGLHLLNLGGNNLTGHISSSLGDLTQLESLDLSQNQLSGEIPLQLTRITFLAFFNVSNNHLSGPIPQGKQFATFSSASFDGNPGLCGSPLSRACGSSEASPPTSSSSKQGSTSEFDWKFVLMGYGSGLVIGVSIGYCLTSWKHEWFVKTFGKRQRKWTRKERRGAQRLNLSNPNFLERFLKLCILLELLDFYLHFFSFIVMVLLQLVFVLANGCKTAWVLNGKLSSNTSPLRLFYLQTFL
ncbi:Receptor like protein 42 [Vitis vinifera]|uniref:Receptor like protein 42 n=1 Tax=Vitis vinifera TaxID=29760 RepID=A0A438FWX6_VITVI|nr:Receptor like protein 42 [Vitis vinifera]